MDWNKTTPAGKQPKKDDELKPFVFTYGSDESYPYYGGWCVIYAENRSEACDIHKDKYGLYKQEYLGNFAFCYSMEEFAKTGMRESGNLGNYCHAVHDCRRCTVYYSPARGKFDKMIEERAKKIVGTVINKNEKAGLIDATEDILDVCFTTLLSEQPKAIARLLEDFKDDLVYWLSIESTDYIHDLEQLVYAKRKIDAVQIYYDNMDRIGDITNCSIKDLMDEIIYFAGW